MFAEAIKNQELLKVFKPEIIILPNPEDVDGYVFRFLAEMIQTKPNSVLTLPTGNTPVQMYQLLSDEKLDFSRVTIFNLDEYWPISKEHPASYYQFMKRNLINKVNIDWKNWHIPNGESDDPDIEAAKYEDLIAKSGMVDLAVLGIGPGTTCHIGFNEKGTPLDSTTHYLSALDSETIAANEKLFEDPQDMPRGAITQGIATILNARKILLIAKGEGKAWGIARSLNGPIGVDAPASFLRYHSDVTYVVDRVAGKLLNQF